MKAVIEQSRTDRKGAAFMDSDASVGRPRQRAGVLLAVTLACALGVPLAAQAEPHGRPGFEREHFQSPHWVYDDRYRHGHFYPAVGYSLGVLPVGHIPIEFRDGRYFFHAGVWYRGVPGGFVVVRPPLGIILPVLPPVYSTVWYGGVPYYYANEVYYTEVPGGYAVTQPPVDASQLAPAPAQVAPAPAPTAPAQGAPAQQPGMWYFCNSSKTYYPYVQQCPEGWQAVPATPSAPR
jgi:hypothetical protein